MNVYAYEIKEDDTVDISNPIVVNASQPIPDGYRLVTPDDDLTYGEPLEGEQQQPSEADRLDAIESALLAILMTGG